MNRNTLLHDDCLQYLPRLPCESIDFILTDPPYLCDTSRVMVAQCPMTTMMHG
jgi:DNA modification methylase